MDSLETVISEYYDCEVPNSKILNLEAKIATSNILNNYINQIHSEYYVISKSIKRIKNKINRHLFR